MKNFFKIGTKAGVNINKINGRSYEEGFSYDYLLGGFMQFNFSKRFGIQPEVILHNPLQNLLMMPQKTRLKTGKINTYV